MNVQYAIQRDTVYVLEVNPRASRTVPYVSKATGVPLAKMAARLMAGRRLADMNLPLVKHNGVVEIAVHDFYAVKSPVFPFNKFRGVDTILGPEMRSTGEVMGISNFLRPGVRESATGRRTEPAGKGTVFLSVNDRDKRQSARSAKNWCRSASNCSRRAERPRLWTPPAWTRSRYSKSTKAARTSWTWSRRARSI